MQRQLDMHASNAGGGAVDPVCGMTVDPDTARDRGLVASYENQDYFFCGKGCKLDFLDEPTRFLAADYQPQM